MVNWLIDWLIVAVHRGQGEPGCKVKGIGNEWLIDWLSRYTEDREIWTAKLREPEDGGLIGWLMIDWLIVWVYRG